MLLRSKFLRSTAAKREVMRSAGDNEEDGFDEMRVVEEQCREIMNGRRYLKKRENDA